MGERALHGRRATILALVLLRSSILSGGNVDAEGYASMPEAVDEGAYMVAHAIDTLSRGWDGMSERERELFLRFYDPGATGDIDAEFIESVVENFKRIDRKLGSTLAIKSVENGGICEGMRLFYTTFISIHACPYIEIESNQSRIARDLVHEVAHMALLSLDRAYYHDDYSPYQALTPRGHWTADLPLIGRLLREVARADTEYHPDAYSKFAAALLEEEKPEVVQVVEISDEAMTEAQSADARLLDG